MDNKQFANKHFAEAIVEGVLVPLAVHGRDGLTTRVDDAVGNPAAQRIVATISSVRKLIEQALIADGEVALLRSFDTRPHETARLLAEYVERRFTSDPGLVEEVDRVVRAMAHEEVGTYDLFSPALQGVLSDSPFDAAMTGSVTGGGMVAGDRMVVDGLLRGAKLR